MQPKKGKLMKILFRAKEKNTDNYIIGYEYYNHIEDEYYITHYISGNNYKVDKSTRSINFEDMVDSQGNKIFASLSENGKGGDRLIEDGRYEDGCNPVFEPYFRKSNFSIYDLPTTPSGEYKLKWYKIIGIQQ